MMVQFYVLFFIFHLKVIVCIMITGASKEYPQVVEQSTLQNSHTIIPYENQNDFVKFTPIHSTKGSSRRIIGNAVDNSKRHTPLFTQYTSNLDYSVKPIYELNINSNKDLDDHIKIGYLYKQPNAGNFRIPKEDRKNNDYSNELHNLKSAIITLDQYLKHFLNGDSYNSHLHPPINPLLSLILSKYGKYISGASKSDLYAYMAINNIHNNKPFGQYKYAREQDLDTISK